MRTFLKIISYTFQPLIMPTLAVVLLMQTPLFKIIGSTYASIAVVGTLLFTGIFPALPILLMMKKGQVKDLFISRREERTMPYLFSLLAYVFWVLFLWRTLSLPKELLTIAIGSVISVVLMVFINLKWKISAHMAGMGAFTGSVIAASYFLSINPLGLIILSIFVSGLVAISRIFLKAHTLSQTIAGFSLGVCCVFLVSFAYTLIIR